MLTRTLAVSLLLLSPLAVAQPVCDPPTAPTLSSPVVLGNGSPGSVSTPQLQAALNAGGDIRLAIGASTLNLTATLDITRPVRIDGGGATLSGQNTRRVVEIRNPGNRTDYEIVLLNLTLANGNARDLAGDEFARSGGAILNDHGGEPWRAIRLRGFNVRFIDNRAIETAQDGGGGAVYLTGHREFSCVGCEFSGNSGSNGGALYSLGTQEVLLYQSLFEANRATGTGGNPGQGGNGGAIGVDGEQRQVRLCNVRLHGNESNAFGAGLFTVAYDQMSTVRIEQSSIRANRQLSSSQHTGGVYLQGGPFVIRDSLFADNEAAGYGALALFNHGGQTLGGEIVNSTFSNNIARTGLGGAINIGATAPILLQNLTLVGNRALCDVCFAGGIANAANAQITLRNSVFLNNTGGNAFNPWALQRPVSGSNNLQWPQVRPGSFGQQELPVTPGAQFADALLGALGEYGGPTQTAPLAANSPAINAGTATGSTPRDQRGQRRHGAVDLGAYEHLGDVLYRGDLEQWPL